MPTRQEMLIEANSRGLLKGEKKAQFDEAVNRGLITLPNQQQAAQQPPQPAQPEQQQSPQKATLASMASGDPVLGAVENIASFVGSAVLEPISGWAGIASSMFGGAEEGAETVKNVQSAAYQPRSKAGQQIQQGVGELLAPVGEAFTSAEDALGGAALEATGSPAVAAAAATIPTAALELFGLKGARKAKRAVPDVVSPEKAPSLPETGIRATTGEVAQDLAQQKAEQFLLEQTGEAGDQLRGYKLAQSRELKNYLEQVTPDKVDNVGEAVKDAIELRKSSAKFKRKQAYDNLAELTKDTDVKLNTNVIAEKLPEAGEIRDFAATNQGQFNALSNLFTEFGVDLSDGALQRAADKGIEINELSVANAERFRKRLNSIEKSDQTGNTSRFTGPAKEALDGEFNLAAKALEESGAEDVSRAAKNARQSHIALKTEFDEKGMVDKLISTKGRQSNIPKIEESQIYTKLAAKSVPIEEFDRVVKSLDRAGSKGKKAKNQIKAQMMTDIIDSAFSAKSRKINGEQVFGANAFVSRFDELSPKLKSVMSPAEFKKLEKLSKDAKDLIPPSGALPKGSAGFFIEALNKTGVLSVLSSVPGAGVAMAEAIRKVGKSSQDLKAFNKAIKSKPEIKDAVNLISTDYPSLGVALGIPQLREDEQ